MALVETVYNALLVVSIPILVTALYYTVNRLSTRGARPIVAVLSGALIWLVFQLIQRMAPDFLVALTAYRITFFGIPIVVLGWFLFALEYTGRDHLVTRYSVAALSVEPLVVFGLVWTNTSHSLWNEIARRGQSVTQAGVTETCQQVLCFGSQGPAFLVHTIYSYVLLAVGAVLVLIRVFRADEVQRAQAGAMIVAVAAPLVGNVLSLFVLPKTVPDLTPILFTVTGLAMVLGIYRYSLVDASPLASEADVNERDEPAFVVSDRDRIADINAAAGAVLEVDADEIVNADVEEAFEAVPELHERYASPTETPDGLTVANDLTSEQYEVNTENVSAPGDALGGTVFRLERIEDGGG
jgi:hypothetical protein